MGKLLLTATSKASTRQRRRVEKANKANMGFLICGIETRHFLFSQEACQVHTRSAPVRKRKQAEADNALHHKIAIPRCDAVARRFATRLGRKRLRTRKPSGCARVRRKRAYARSLAARFCGETKSLRDRVSPHPPCAKRHKPCGFERLAFPTKQTKPICFCAARP